MHGMKMWYPARARARERERERESRSADRRFEGVDGQAKCLPIGCL